MTEQRPTNPLSKANTARFFTISLESGILQHADAAAAIQNLPAGGYWWFDYCEPALSQLEPLIAQFGIHPLSIEDSLAEDQLPKLDHYPNYSFMIFNFYEQTEEELLTHELDLFLGKNFLISISHLNQLGLPLLTGIDKSVERELPKITLGPSFLAHLMIDVVVDRKFYAIDSIENKLDQDENRILGEAQDFDLSTLLNSRRDLMTIRRSLFYEREVVNKLLRQDSPFIAEKSLIYYRDIFDHLSKYYEISETARDQVTSLMELHLSMTSNRMAESSNRTNAIMHRLTLITTIFMPLSVISGIGGMSEFTMMIGQNNIRVGYLILFVVMLLIAGINYLLLKRMENHLTKEG